MSLERDTGKVCKMISEDVLTCKKDNRFNDQSVIRDMLDVFLLVVNTYVEDPIIFIEDLKLLSVIY